jgi:hypothetical protein
VHPQIAAVGDRGPIRGGQIVAGKTLDLEGIARNAPTRWQINDSHAYALLLDAAMPPPEKRILSHEVLIDRESCQ